MANSVSTSEKDRIREHYLANRSIRLVAKELGLGRNTVRRLLRSEGLLVPNSLNEVQVQPKTQLEKLDFLLLEKMFGKSRVNF